MTDTIRHRGRIITRYYPGDVVPVGKPDTFLMWPQFLDGGHRPTCQLPDKMYRFCDCKEKK